MSAARTGALLLIIGVVGFVAVSPNTATAARDPFGGSGDDDAYAIDLLRRSASAMRTTSYSGTRMVSAWGSDGATTVLVDVEHVAGQGTRLTMRGGGIPRSTATFLASGEAGTARHGELSLGALDMLTETYAVTLADADSVAGRSSTVVEVGRGGTIAARLWVDDRTGLLLRREVFDSNGRLSRESTFIDVHIDSSGFMAHLPPVAPEPGATVVGSRRDIENAGWDCPSQAGTLRLVGIERLEESGAVHMVYSDGLTRMSVFEQQGSLDQGSVAGFERLQVDSQVVHVREGMPTYAVWQRDGIVFTAVTDGPLDTVAGVVRAAPEHA
ncbi:MAG: sigma-E factor regulatory protein RseB domain-containing protein, partial [Nocardioidaceae bacterium]